MLALLIYQRIPGMLQNTVDRIGTTAVSDLGITFNPDPKAWVNKFPATPAHLSRSIAAIDKNFKLPQIWRSNLAVDVKLPSNTILLLKDYILKSINDIVI